MTPTFLPGLAPSDQQREKIRKRVRPTSRAQYAVGRERFTGRKASVLRWLAAYYNKHQNCPTSGELAQYAGDDTELWKQKEWAAGWFGLLLYVRRGLSDLQRAGVVESVTGADRHCAVVKSKCCVWRVKPR